MKAYPLPLSEAFVYGSPERMTGGACRWVIRVKRVKCAARAKCREMRHEHKQK